MSTVTSKDVEKAKKWCEQARALLKTKKTIGKGKTVDSQAMKEALQLATKALEKLKKDPRGKSEYDKLAQEFVNLSKLAETAVNTNNQNMVKLLTAQLQHFPNRVEYACGNITQTDLDNSRQNLTGETEKLYQQELQAAKKMQLELISLGEGIHKFDGPVSQKIASAEQAEKQATGSFREKGVSDALSVLAEVRDLYLSALQRHGKLVAYKSARVEAVDYANRLRLLSDPLAKPVDNVLVAGAKLFEQLDYEGATRKLGEAKSTYEKTIKEQKVSPDQVEYLKKMAEAKSRAVELAARNRDGIDFAAELNKNIQVALGFAKASPPDYKTAAKALGDTKALYETYKKQADNYEKQLNEASRHQPVYADKVLRIESAIRELEALPGTCTFVAKLQSLLQAGERELKSSGNYEAAYKALQGLSQTRQQGLEAASNFKDSVGDELYRSNLQAAEKALDELDKLVGRSQFGLIAEKRQVIQNSLIAIGKGASLPAETLTVGTLAGDLQKLIREAAEDRKNCLEVKQLAESELQEFQKKCLISEFDLLPQLRMADADFSVDNYQAATQQYQQLRTELTRIQSERKLDASFTTWTEKFKELNTKNQLDNSLSPMELLAKTRSEACQPLLRLGAPLETEMAQLLKSLGQTRDYAAAVVTADKVLNAAPQMAALLKQHQEAAEHRKTLDTQGKQLQKAAQLQIDALQKLGGDVGPFTTRLNDAVNAWRLKLSVGEFVDKEQWNTAFEQYRTELETQVIQAIADVIKNDSGQLDASKQSASDAKARQALDKQLQAIAGSIREMQADAGAFEFLGPLVATSGLPEPIIQSANDRLSDLRSDSTTAVDQLAANATQLQSDIEEVLTKLLDEKNKLSDLARQRAQECQTMINNLKKGHKDFAPFFTSSSAAVEDYVAMANSSVCSTVERAVFLLNEISSRQLEPLTAAFEELNRQFEAIKTNLDDADFKKLMPDRRKTFDFRFNKEVKLEAYNKGPIAGKAAVDEFARELNAAVQAAHKAVNTRAEIARIAKECSLKVEMLREAPHLQKSFSKMIDGALSPSENGETTALQQMIVLNNQLNSLVTEEGQKLLPEMERATREKELDAELKRQKFEAARDVLEKNQIRDAENRLKELPKSKVNVELYKEIQENLKQADDMFKKGLIDVALERLESARATAVRFTNNPFNVQTTARNQLDKVVTRWNQAVGQFVKGMGTLQLSVQQSMDEENKLQPGRFDVGAVLSPLSEVAKSFQADKFDGWVKTITSELAREKIQDFKAYRQAKEEALRFVRQYQAIVAKDPVLSQVENNPFGVIVPVPGLRDALRDLELNLRRA